MPIDNQLMRTRVGTYNFCQRFLKQKINSNKQKSYLFLFYLFHLVALFILILLYLLSAYFTFSKFKSICAFHVSCMTLEFSFIAYFVRLLLLRAGDIEKNPGPKKSIKFCHWNLNGLAAHGFVKIPLIETFINTLNFDIICLYETFLDSTIPQNDENINIKGYSLLRADHPGNSKRGGVCLYYKEYLPLIARNDISCMQGCLVTELSMNNEKSFFRCLYRSPSQSHEELDTFCSNLDLLLSNINNNHPNCSILIGDFNAKSSRWCSSDKDNKAGCELDNITTSAGYSQMINKPTHFINESSSCIDLIFSSNHSLTKNCGIDHSIYDKCHHNIIYGTLNFKVPLPPPYYREIKKIFKIFKRLFQCLIGEVHSKAIQ